MSEYHHDTDADAWAHSPPPEPVPPPPPATGTPARTLASELHDMAMNTRAIADNAPLDGRYLVGHRDARHAIAEALLGHPALRQPAPVAAGGAGKGGIPSEIHVCGQRYAIVPDGETVHAVHGMIVFGQGRIELNTQCDAELLRVTLLHEVIHGIDKMLVGDPGITARLRGPPNDQLLRLTEPEVLALSQGLWMTLTDPRNRAAVEWMLGTVRAAGGAGRGERRWLCLYRPTSHHPWRAGIDTFETESEARGHYTVPADTDCLRVVPVLVTVLEDDAGAGGAERGTEVIPGNDRGDYQIGELMGVWLRAHVTGSDADYMRASFSVMQSAANSLSATLKELDDVKARLAAAESARAAAETALAEIMNCGDDKAADIARALLVKYGKIADQLG